MSGTTDTFGTLVMNGVKPFGNTIIGALVALAVVIFFIGLVRFIYHSGDAKGTETGRSLMLWGFVAIFVLLTLWGIIALISSNLFNGSTNGSTLPNSGAQFPGPKPVQVTF